MSSLGPYRIPFRSSTRNHFRSRDTTDALRVKVSVAVSRSPKKVGKAEAVTSSERGQIEKTGAILLSSLSDETHGSGTSTEEHTLSIPDTQLSNPFFAGPLDRPSNTLDQRISLVGGSIEYFGLCWISG